jgi:hypothetical protein
LEEPGINWRIILKWVWNKQDRRSWTDFIWLGTGISDGLLWTPKLIPGFYIVRGISWLAKVHEAYQSFFIYQLMHKWIVFKTSLKFTLKLTLKRSDMLRCNHHHQGAHYSSLLKLQLLK